MSKPSFYSMTTPPGTSTKQRSPDTSTTKAVKDITWHITFISRHPKHPETNQQNNILLQIHHRQTPIARDRFERSPVRVEKYILARLSIQFPLDTSKSRGSFSGH
jgi:hypothetical protein